MQENGMKRSLPLLTATALVAIGGICGSALAEQGGSQSEMRRAVRSRCVLSSNEVARRIVPTMPGMQYLGPEYDPVAMAYRLKFIRNGRVVFVDVDARTGRIIGEHR
jgi:hypothetical protein